MRGFVFVLGVLVLGAVVWPASAPPVRPLDLPDPVVSSAPTIVPAPVESPKPRRGSRDLFDPPPPPEPSSPPRPTYPYGEITGCVEDEDGCAVASFSLSSRRFGCRRGSPAGRGEAGAGGTFRFRVQRLDFFRDPAPPGQEPSRWLFMVWADGFVVGTYRLAEDEEADLRRKGRITGVRIVLPRAVVLQGRVLWPEGTAVKGHWVNVTTREGDREVEVSSTRTDKEGWYRFSHLRPRPGLRIHATATLGDSKGKAVSRHVPLDDDIAGGDLLHFDLRLGPWVSE